jgi:hypothetical protein
VLPAAPNFVPNNGAPVARTAPNASQAVEQASEFHGDAGNSLDHAA